MFTDRREPRRAGFTLMELVVVTAIGGLLIAAVLPTLKPLRDRSSQLVCEANLSQQYAAASEYAFDNEDYYPRGIMGVEDMSGEYNTYATALLPYLGWHDKAPRWAEPGSPGWRTVLRETNHILLGFDVFHCPGFPVDYYDDPNDQRFFYSSSHLDDLYGPGGVNPLHYAVSTFPTPFGQFSLDLDGVGSGDGVGVDCWDEQGGVWGVASSPGDPPHYAESSRLEDFPDSCPPSTKVYVTGVDKTVPWIKQSYSGGPFVGIRFYTAFLMQHLNHASHPRLCEDWRHQGGTNNLFFDGHVKMLPPHEIDPGCGVPANERLALFTIPYDGWDGWGDP